MINLKDFITENLLTKNKRFNNRATSEKWWSIRNYNAVYDEILSETAFLPTESLITRRAYHLTNDLYEIEFCIHCNKNPKIFVNFASGYSKFCSNTCATKSSQRTNKIKRTNLERYGCICSAQNPDVQTKIKNNNKEKYGVEFTSQLDSTKEKAKKTRLIKYGNENYNNQTQSKATCLKKYGTEYSTQAQSVIDKIQETKGLATPQLRDRNWLIQQNETKGIREIANDLNVTYRSVWLWMYKHDIEFETHRTKDFKEQIAIYEFIKSLGIESVTYNNRKVISPKELDIYLPDCNLAIELNGMYFHQEDKIKHLDKLNLCNSKNIKLLQFWDYEWLLKEEICKSIIKSNLKQNERIFARKCKIIEVPFKQYTKFMDDNHMQGSATASIRYGLIYNNELVSCISFAKPRAKANKIKYSWELVRYANKLNVNVIGGFSKLFKHSNLNNIISYCDLMRFNGKMYLESGFTQLENSSVGYSYFKGYNVKSREYFQKHNIEKHLKYYDPSLSTADNIWNNGWRKIYNCGNGVFVYTKS
jgi:hypothetical protein